MTQKLKENTKYAGLGLVSGVLNGLFGAGGGVVVVPMLEKFGVDTKKSHATSVAIILPASVVSAYLYFSAGHLDLARVGCYLPGGLIGAAVGAWLLKKIRNKWLKVAFALLIIAGAVRMWCS